MLIIGGIRAHHYFTKYFYKTNNFEIMQVVTDRGFIFILNL